MSNPDGTTGYREVKYVKPGVTVVTYNDRELTIKTHGESNEDFASKVKARTGKVPRGYKTREQAYKERRAAAKKKRESALKEKRKAAAARRKASTTKKPTAAKKETSSKTPAKRTTTASKTSKPRTAPKMESRASQKVNPKKMDALAKLRAMGYEIE